MIPGTPFETGSHAEKRIFERLRLAFDNGYTAFHSLKPTTHPYKQFPEVDFVIVGPEGLFALEVKGGKVTVQNGDWHYQDGHGSEKFQMQDPFRQAATAMHGLTVDLRENLPGHVHNAMATGFGVIFPDCRWDTHSSEWDREMVADRRRCRDLGQWLRQLFAYWRQRGGSQELLDDDALATVRRFIRPNVDADIESVDLKVPLHQQVGQVERRIERLTADQMRMADVAQANSRVLCTGGAGTGKTYLAERLAQKWTDQGMQVALVCRSPWLRHHLASRLAIPGLSVSLIDGICLDCSRAGLDRFDALIVDEGQDLFDMASIEILDQVLAGGLESGRWCWFYDLNNQALSGNFDTSAKEFLEAINPVCMPLNINCRNTRVILKYVQERLGADIGTRGAGAGPDVRYCMVSNRQESAEQVSREIVELVDVGGLAPGSVTILSPFDYFDSSVSELPVDTAIKIGQLDEFSIRRMPVDKVGFARIDEFKGLENEAIIVVDLPAPDGTDRELPKHYVAMTRARAVLSIVQFGS
ncbi:MAG: NERD domain-containing protein [Rhodobacteraceae bacterium]|nr:NERD domain-containing protein [Paracoccaceae bacterium]MCY4138525.1 NERD domain-containing protein [Paracoccaceae bacterium]